MNQQSNNPEEKNNFKDLLRDIILPKVEIISVVLIVVAIVFKQFGLEGFETIFTIGLSNLAIVAYLGAFLYKTDNLAQIFVVRIGHIACSIALVGIMFTALSFPGNEPMLSIGGISLAMATVALAYLQSKPDCTLPRQILIRFGTILFLTLVTIFL
jgi:hypothetical protein